MAVGDSDEARTEKQEESPTERTARELRLSQWGGEWQGTRISGNVLLVAVKTVPQNKPDQTP
jgi:hypothetical protein